MTSNWTKKNLIKFIFILILLICIKTSFGQNEVLMQNISLDNKKLLPTEALREISNQIGFYFIYNANLLQSSQKQKINLENQPLSSALFAIFSDSTITFQVIDKYIVIKSSSRFNEKSDIQQHTNIVDYIEIKGRIIDSDDGTPLSFATVCIDNENVGTIANIDGNFQLKISTSDLSKNLCFSYIGFKVMKIPINELISGRIIIPLEKDYISIQEVIIRQTDPHSLIKKSLDNIKRNYSVEPVYFTAFYREWVKKNNDYLTISEAIIKIYKSSYSKLFDTDMIKILKARKIENTNLIDTVMIKLKAGLQACIELDVIKNPIDFLQETNFKNYNYRMTDIVIYEGQPAYVIQFEQNENTSIPLYIGNVYITIDSLAIVATEFQINPKKISEAIDMLVSKNRSRYSLKPEKAYYRISYRKVGSRYFLNHVRGELVMKVKKKRRLFSNTFYLCFEMVNCLIENENVQRFSRKEMDNPRMIFSDDVRNFNADFWGNNNIIEPEANLDEAIKIIKERLSKPE